MPDMEIEELIGPGLEPTDAFVSSLREQIAGEWHGVTAAPVAARRRWPRVMIAAASVAAVVGGVVFVAGRDDRQHTVTPAETSVPPPPPPLPLQIRRISTITFDTSTDAWVASNGLAALYQRDDQWFLGEYDAKGKTGETPVDVVGDGPEHTVSVFPEDAPTIGMITPGGVVIDGYVYAKGVDGWAKGACWACAADMLAPPTASSDGQGQLTAKYGGREWSFAAPQRVDDDPEVLSVGSAAEPTVGVLAHMGDSTVVAFGRPDASTGTAVVAGKWLAVGTQRNGMLARPPDPTRRDYSVSLIPWPTIDDANGYERVATIAIPDSTVTWVGRSGKLALYSRAGVAMVGIFDPNGLVAETSLGVAAPAGGMTVESNLDDTKLSVNGVSFSLADGDWRRCTECFTGDLLAGSATLTLDEAGQLWDIGWNGETWQIPFADSVPGVQPVAVVVRGEAVAFSVPTKSGGLMYALLRPGQLAAVARLADNWVAVGADLDGLLARREDQTNRVFSVDRIPWPAAPNDGRWATITFDRSTKAWVGKSGRQALVHDEDGWWIAQYDGHGEVARQIVDGGVTDGSTFADTGGTGVMDPTHVVIDGYFYALVDGSWRRGVSLATAYWMPDLQPVIESTKDGRWMIRSTSTGDLWRLPVPADAVGTAVATNTGDGVLVAVASTDPAVALQLVAVRGGVLSAFAIPSRGVDYRLLSATSRGVLLQHVGSERDYSVDLFPWPAAADAPSVVEPGVLYVQVDASLIGWFIVDDQGNRHGFDGCVMYGPDSDPPIDCSEALSRTAPGERFDAAGPVATGGLAGSWRTDAGHFLTFQSDGSLLMGACPDVHGTWTLGDVLRTQTAEADWACLPGEAMLRSALAAGARTSLRVDGTLWLATDDSVVRLRPVGPVGDDSSPAAGGAAIAQWQTQYLESDGVSLDEVHVGVLGDGQLAALSADGWKVLIIDASGVVVDTVGLAQPQQQMLVHPGDVAELVAGDDARTWISLAAGQRGQVVAATTPSDFTPPRCQSVVVSIGTDVSAAVPTVPEADCLLSTSPTLLPNGSILMTVATGSGDITTVTAVKLASDGTLSSVVLGRHAVDGAEGWVKYQATATGGVVLFHYPDDTVVLYRYTFPSA